MGSFRGIWLFFLLSLCHLLGTECRIYELGARLLYGQSDAALAFLGNAGDVLQDKHFGFGLEGSLDFELECEPTTHKNSEIAIPNLWLLGCTALEKREIMEAGRTGLNQACQKLQFPEAEENFTMLCEAIPMQPLGQSPGGNLWDAHHSIHRDTFLRFVMLQCPREVPNKTRTRVAEAQCKGRLVLMNNKGYSHLSKDEGSLPPIYKTLLVLWIVLLALWIVNWFKFRQYSNRLHKLLFVAPSFKFLLLILTLAWWEVIAATGYENTSLQMCRDMVQSTEIAMLFMSMMLAAEGWCVIRPRIRNIRCVLIPGLFLVFLGSSICVIWVHNYFMAFAVCSIVFVIYRALKWCTYNLDYLTQQVLRSLHTAAEKRLRFRGVSIAKQLTEKRNIFVRLRLVCAIYTIVFAVTVTMSTFLTEYAWARTLAAELPEVAAFAALGLIFRLRDFGPFERIEVIQPKESSVLMLLPFSSKKCPIRQKIVLGDPVESSTEYSDDDGYEDDKT
ncbi:uncharacterized protein LOC110983113 [Acanthaster planci]|uniref:Uncharacterized protein LOC110983113 n=1 Tax=Acanthaster planci TaxID=133434 RepID=A0A8B7Z321_ACAPL|nr:uncharacterized protein LOC110983113 [Acanthaster planci]